MKNSEKTPPNAPFDPPATALIVDNEADHADTVAESLERVGFQCSVATSGQEGAKKIAETSFDVIITDLMMNDIDGLESSRAPRRSSPTPK